ncbi:MAG: GTPase HflX [Treponema sp.]|jgi:GTP-binding protein HflX|nr:GTPase HflX [Treponema sp.]
MYETKPGPPKVFIAGIIESSLARSGVENAEMAGLADTLGLEITGTAAFTVREKNPRYGMGSGKAKELSDKALAAGAECIIFDQEISPSQQRNWEKLCGLSVLDRQELIIRIFASRARTKEAELQAELAELLYALPRLSHKYVDLSRQRGGYYGTRGAGETRLETDRRKIRQRISILREEIEAVRRSRKLQHKQREKQKIPVCALVGYTNAGKSSLHRVLTGSDVLVEDKLFATLDPTARRVNRLDSSGQRKNIILVDTVGFIRRLPHNLVDAFQATLEEAAQADLLIHVVDAADPGWQENKTVVLELLKNLGAGEIPLITVFNKADMLSPEELADLEVDDAGITVSAKNRKGLESLWNLIEKTLKF